MKDKLTNPVSTSFDDELYAFAKRDAELLGLDVSSYIRATLIEKREKRFNELRVFQDLIKIQEIE
jgi:hypothetical protein|tara:strand:- start:374 stop:568 length:195 start_codon:yes stop_codon:yes gene_type:complete